MNKLSIITINLNNFLGLQKTVESVFAQTFTDFEYIIIDGGSTDGSKELIEKHENKLVCWMSEKDKGIYNAMNKGIARAKGEYLLFLNSGDYFYNSDSLNLISSDANNEDLIYGNMMLNHGDSIDRQTYPTFLNFEYFLDGHTLPHHSTLIKRTLFDKVGIYNEDLKMLSDREFFMNAVCLHNASYKYVPVDVAVFSFDGFCSDPKNGHLYGEEFKKIYEAHYAAFESILKKKNDYERQLRLIKSSRLHKVAEGIMNTPFYKMLKKKLF